MKSDIIFEKNPETNQLNVTITTERLLMESTQPVHFYHYKKLFMNSENMLKVMDGNPWSENNISQRHEQWVANWSNDNPFSSFAVLKKDTEEFIEHVVLEETGQPGFSELAYAFDKQFWGKGYGKEVILLIVQEYAPELVKRDYKLAGESFKRIEATARPDNPASINLLKPAAFNKFYEQPKWGQLRHFFFVDTNDLTKVSMQPFYLPRLD